MTNAIRGFQGEYRFLSNFWPAEVEVAAMQFPTVEHAYQAAKFPHDYAAQMRIRAVATPGRAKRAGQSGTPRSDWNDVKAFAAALKKLSDEGRKIQK